MAYNRDNQEDKEPIFDALDTSVACLEIMTLMIKVLEPNRKRMLQKAGAGFSCATDIADWLVRQGAPFRCAHELTGKAVQLVIRQGVALQCRHFQQMSSYSLVASLSNFPLPVCTHKSVSQTKTLTAGLPQSKSESAWRKSTTT